MSGLSVQLHLDMAHAGIGPSDGAPTLRHDAAFWDVQLVLASGADSAAAVRPDSGSTADPGDGTARFVGQTVDSTPAQLASGGALAMAGTELLTGHQSEPLSISLGFAAPAARDEAIIGQVGQWTAVADAVDGSIRPQTPSPIAASDNEPSAADRTPTAAPASLLQLADLPADFAPITGVTALAAPDGDTVLLARLTNAPSEPAPAQAQHSLGAGLVLSIVGDAAAQRSVTFNWHGDQLWPVMSQPLGQAAAGILAASASHAPIEAVSLSFAISMSRPDALEPPSGRLRFADGQSVAFGTSAPAPGPHDTMLRPQTETRLVISLSAGGGETPGADARAVCESRATVPIDLSPAPDVRTPDPPPRPLWRIDETRCFVSIGSQGMPPALAQAHALYRRLITGDMGLADLQPGEGFATWDGSPLWLRLAGITKRFELGIALSESDPSRLEVWRDPDGTWDITRGSLPLHLPADAGQDEALFHAALFGLPPALADPWQRAMPYRRARAAMLRARQSHPAEDDASRAEEAWAAVARHAAITAARCPVLATLLDSPSPADWQHLNGVGDAVLARIADGDLQTIGRGDGIALAVRLGHMRPTDILN